MTKEDLLSDIASYVAGVEDGTLTHKRDEIGHYESEELLVDTCHDPVGDHFETAVCDLRYGGGTCWIIVERYDDRVRAKERHNHWIQLLTGDQPPAELRDIDIYDIGIDPYPLIAP